MRGVALVLAVVMVFAIPTAALAADGDDGGGLWDVISAIGDFFMGIIDVIWGAIKSVVGAIWDAIKWLLDGLKALFIPREDFFPKAFARFQNKLSEKFGGLVGMASYLSSRFNELRPYRGLSDEYSIHFPAGHLLNGVSVPLLDDFAGVVDMIRGALSGAVCIITFFFCYRRLLAQVNT